MPGIRPAKSAAKVTKTEKTKGAARAKAPTNCGSGAGGFKPGNICGKGKRQALAQKLRAARSEAKASGADMSALRKDAKAIREHRRNKDGSISHDQAREIHGRLGGTVKTVDRVSDPVIPVKHEQPKIIHATKEDHAVPSNPRAKAARENLIALAEKAKSEPIRDNTISWDVTRHGLHLSKSEAIELSHHLGAGTNFRGRPHANKRAALIAISGKIQAHAKSFRDISHAKKTADDAARQAEAAKAAEMKAKHSSGGRFERIKAKLEARKAAYRQSDESKAHAENFQSYLSARDRLKAAKSPAEKRTAKREHDEALQKYETSFANRGQAKHIANLDHRLTMALISGRLRERASGVEDPHIIRSSVSHDMGKYAGVHNAGHNTLKHHDPDPYQHQKNREMVARLDTYERIYADSMNSPESYLQANAHYRGLNASELTEHGLATARHLAGKQGVRDPGIRPMRDTPKKGG